MAAYFKTLKLIITVKNNVMLILQEQICSAFNSVVNTHVH